MQENKPFLAEVVYRGIIILLLFFFSRSLILNSGWRILKIIFPERTSIFTTLRFLFLAVTFLIVGEYFLLERMPENYLLSRIGGLGMMILVILSTYGTYYLTFKSHSYALLVIVIIIAIASGQLVSYQIQRRRSIRFGYSLAFFNYFLLAVLLMLLTVLQPRGFLFS
jgi:hypothetical protein